MWNLWISAYLWKENSPGTLHRKKSDREKYIASISRNLRKMWHTLWVEDPIGELLQHLSDISGKKYTSLEDLDDVSLEWLASQTIHGVHELCLDIKTKSQLIIEKKDA